MNERTELMKETAELLVYILCCDRKKAQKTITKATTKISNETKKGRAMEITAGHGLPAYFPASIHLTFTIQVHYALLINFKFVFLFFVYNFLINVCTSFIPSISIC
jgi:hypothetical protein